MHKVELMATFSQSPFVLVNQLFLFCLLSNKVFPKKATDFTAKIYLLFRENIIFFFRHLLPLEVIE